MSDFTGTTTYPGAPDSFDVTKDAGDPLGQDVVNARAAINALETTLDSQLDDFSVVAASGKGFVEHGATAGTARPSGFASIEWVGSVTPTNAVDGDTWIDTT